jgi:hypothetical protein
MSIDYMKKMPIALLLLASILVALSIFSGSINTNTSTNNASSNTSTYIDTITDLINHFVIEEFDIVGTCAHIRGRAILQPQLNATINAYIIHCKEKIYVFVEILLS